VADDEWVDDESADDEWAERQEGGNMRVIDIGGSLTQLKAELETGAGDQSRYYEFQAPLDLEADLGGG